MKLIHILLLSVLVAAILIVMSNSSRMASRIRKKIYGNNKFTGQFYSVNGLQMYCEVYGSGDPLLMIHGNGGSIAAFTKQIPYFSKRYKVIVADSRAQGKSIDHSDSLTYEQMADDFAALLSAMNIDSANVLGWSDGGINGLLLAMRHPEKVKKLVVTGANLWPDTSAVDAATIAEVMPRYIELKEMFSDSSTGGSFIDSTEFKLLKLLIEQPHIELSALQKIQAPTLVIGGDHDLIRPAHTLQLFEHIPHAYLWILPHCGHSTLIDYADEFNKKTAAFFKNPYKKAEKRTMNFKSSTF